MNMATIQVTGTISPPDHIQENLAELTTIKECQQRRSKIASLVQGIDQEIEQLQDEKRALEMEDYWIGPRMAQILEENPEEAEAWARYKAVHNPNQQRFPFLGGTQPI